MAAIELEGLEQGLSILREIQRRGRDLRPAMEEIGSYLVDSTLGRFDREQAPSGAPWLPTRRGGRILRDTGRLASSLTFVAGADFVEVGTNVLYARIHQLGGEIRPKNAPYLVFKTPQGGFVRTKKVTIPARPFLGASPADAEEIEQIAIDYLEGVF